MSDLVLAISDIGMLIFFIILAAVITIYVGDNLKWLME